MKNIIKLSKKELFILHSLIIYDLIMFIIVSPFIP